MKLPTSESIQYSLLIAFKVVRRKMEEAWVYITGTTRLIGFNIQGLGPFVVKIRTAENCEFWWYSVNKKWGGIPLVIILHSNFIYDITAGKVLKDRCTSSDRPTDPRGYFSGAKKIPIPSSKEAAFMCELSHRFLASQIKQN